MLVGFFKSKPLRFWILLLGMFLAILGYEEIVDDVFQDPQVGDYEVVRFDSSVATFLQQFRSSRLTQAMTDITALGSVSVCATFVIILISVLISYRDVKGILYLLVTSIGAGIIPQFLKVHYGRARPEILDHLVHVSDLSFPSGHAFGATAIYLALAFYSGQYARSWIEELFFYFLGGLVIFLVCISRIYLGVHYPTDVLGGLFGGAIWTFGISTLFVMLSRYKSQLTTYNSLPP